QIVGHTSEPSTGGLLQVNQIGTWPPLRAPKTRKSKKTIRSTFLSCSTIVAFHSHAASSLPDDSKTSRYLAQTGSYLAAIYDRHESEDRTSAEEVKRYLDLAELLGLFDKLSREAFVGGLARQFPDGFGKVNISYIVRYDNAALRDALGSVSAEELRELARQTMRRLIGAKYTGMKQNDWLPRVGFAYLSPSLHEAYDKEGFTALRQFKTVTLPAWFTRDAPMKVDLSSSDIQFLITLCNIETSYADRLVKLDQVLDRALKEKKPVPLDDLKNAARKFVDLADELDEWRENAFFAIFDKLVEAALKKVPQSQAPRESAMVLEITPDAKDKVTKVLMQRN